MYNFFGHCNVQKFSIQQIIVNTICKKMQVRVCQTWNSLHELAFPVCRLCKHLFGLITHLDMLIDSFGAVRHQPWTIFRFWFCKPSGAVNVFRNQTSLSDTKIPSVDCLDFVMNLGITTWSCSVWNINNYLLCLFSTIPFFQSI